MLASSPLVRRSLLATTQLPASEACYLQLLDPESCWLPFPGPPGLLASCKPCWHAEGLLGQAALGHSLPADTPSRNSVLERPSLLLACKFESALAKASHLPIRWHCLVDRSSQVISLASLGQPSMMILNSTSPGASRLVQLLWLMCQLLQSSKDQASCTWSCIHH